MSSDDLSDRLRFVSDRHECPGERDCSYCEVLREAADRVDRAEAVCEAVESGMEHGPGIGLAKHEAVKEALADWRALRESGGGE